MRKSPRDFVHIDEFWEADDRWNQYYFRKKVWVYFDEYRAELPGDETYSRIIIRSAEDEGWLFSRSLCEKSIVQKTVAKITQPVSEQQLKELGFSAWRTN
ncbi:MAG: hypothetical protein V7746_25985 [Halioglobus sp.]